MKTVRVEWEEQRCTSGGGFELFSVIAEREGDGEKQKWVFYEKSSWDVYWVSIPPTASSTAKADVEFAKGIASAKQSPPRQ